MNTKLTRREAIGAAVSVAGGVAGLSLPRSARGAAGGTGANRPNIIFILADDLGYGDLGCYGQARIKTPNIDRLAAEGMRFTQCYAGSTVCAPSRCCLMTGFHTGHALIRGNARFPLRPEDVTVAEVLKGAGYTTGIVGKWGLGEPETTGVPNRQGFDYWFGYLNQRRAHNYWPDYLWKNEEKYLLPNVLARENIASEFFDSNGPLRGIKRDLYDGGIRVPMIARWPGTIEAGAVSDQVWAFWDFPPTAAELGGTVFPPGVDGISMVPALLGNEQKDHDYLYWEFFERGFKQAVRIGDWKAVNFGGRKPIELYDLNKDIGEKYNVADNHPDVVAKMKVIFKTARTESTLFPRRRRKR